jgi:rhodanese-related sulfurtransferase
MGLFDYFKPVSTMNAEDVRAFLRERDPESYNLVDVRQPWEYEEGHLPGARLIPIAHLPGRLGELDRSKPTIAYCGSGVRSRAAASILGEAGFQKTWSMTGGINAWNGLVAEGRYESELSYFSGASNAEEMIALSLALEAGNRILYERLSGDVGEGEAGSLFRSLGMAEKRHEETLRGLHARIAPQAPPPALPEGIGGEGLLEDGTQVRAGLERVRGKSMREAMEILIAMEANAMDRYIKMGRTVEDERCSKVFSALAEEERSHVGRMADLLERLPR